MPTSNLLKRTAVLGLALTAAAAGLYYALGAHTNTPQQVAAARALDPNALKLLTANIRYANPSDGTNNWPHREELAINVLRKQDADVIALQEVTPAQAAALVREFPTYTYLPKPAESQGVLSAITETLTSPNLTALLIRTDRFEILATDASMVSPNARKLKPTDNAYYTLAVLKDKTDRFPPLVILNAHLRHDRTAAIADATRIHDILSEQLKAHPGAQPVVMGDLNHARNSPVYTPLLGNPDAPTALKDTFTYPQDLRTANMGTWHQFTGRPAAMLPADLILVSKSLPHTPAQIIKDHNEKTGRYPSDHFFVTTTLQPPTQ